MEHGNIFLGKNNTGLWRLKLTFFNNVLVKKIILCLGLCFLPSEGKKKWSFG